MNARHAFRHVPQLLAAMLVVSVLGQAENPTTSRDMVPFSNPTGFAATFSTTGSIDFGSPFFQSLGTNGRSCGTCHQPSDGWTVTPEHIRARFDAYGWDRSDLSHQ